MEVTMKSIRKTNKMALMAVVLMVSAMLTALGGKTAGRGDALPPVDLERSFQFVMGTKYYAPPNIPMPQKGISIIDKNFHTTVTRITDKKTDKYIGPGIQNEYAKADPENCDGTLLVLRGNSAAWYLYNPVTYRKIGYLKIFDSGGQEPEPRWDSSNPKIFYYLNNMQLRSYNTGTKKVTTIHDFSQLFPSGAYLTTGSEGDASLDRRYWAFMVLDDSWELMSVIVYDKELDQIIGRKDTGFLDKINWVGMDMSGNHCIFGYEELLYPQVFTRSLSKVVNLPQGSNAHADFARTADGKDVLVYQNVSTDYISMADLDTGKETRLVKIPFTTNPDIGLHFSGNCAQTPGWVLVSTYASKNLPPEASRHSWMDTQLFMVELKKKPRIWRIAHTHAYTSLDYNGEKNYFAECFAAINTKGTRIYYGSNWNDFRTDYSEAYVIRLPNNWFKEMPKTAE
jgi:hypothetical protein